MSSNICNLILVCKIIPREDICWFCQLKTVYTNKLLSFLWRTSCLLLLPELLGALEGLLGLYFYMCTRLWQRCGDTLPSILFHPNTTTMFAVTSNRLTLGNVREGKKWGIFLAVLEIYRVLHSLKQNKIEQPEIARITKFGIPETLSIKI